MPSLHGGFISREVQDDEQKRENDAVVVSVAVTYTKSATSILQKKVLKAREGHFAFFFLRRPPPQFSPAAGSHALQKRGKNKRQK